MDEENHTATIKDWDADSCLFRSLSSPGVLIFIEDYAPGVILKEFIDWRSLL